jgi:hypothetical protein
MSKVTLINDFGHFRPDTIIVYLQSVFKSLNLRLMVDLKTVR